jgi:predicted RNA-binding protein with PUA-like domain
MLKAKGDAGQEWDGVRNYAARNNMRAMQIGDKGFFYHSNEGLAVVGIAEVVALAHPDSTADNPTWECVDIKAVCDVPKPVTLDRVKATPELSNTALVKFSRLSVQPVTEEEYTLICRMGGVDTPPRSP